MQRIKNLNLIHLFQGLTISLFIFLIYIKTVCPTLAWLDAGELLSAAYTLGVAHPAGSCLLMILTKGFSFIATGISEHQFALAGNLLSAFLAAATAFVIFYSLRILTSNSLASSIGALCFGFADTVWCRATVMEVYTLNAFLYALFIFFWLKFFSEDKIKYFYALAFLLGFGLAGHLTFGLTWILSVLFFIIFLILKKFALDWAKYFAGIIFFILGLSIFLYFPLRVWQHLQFPEKSFYEFFTIRNLDGLLWYLQGKLYFKATSYQDLGASFIKAFKQLYQSFGIAGLALVILGFLNHSIRILLLFKKSKIDFTSNNNKRAEFCFLSALVLLMTFFAYGFYIIGQTSQKHFYMPLYIILAIWIGLGTNSILLYLHQHKEIFKIKQKSIFFTFLGLAFFWMIITFLGHNYIRVIIKEMPNFFSYLIEIITFLAIIACGATALILILGLASFAFKIKKNQPFKTVALYSGFLFLPLLTLFSNWSANDLSHDFSAYNYAKDIYRKIEPNSVIFFEWDNAFQLFYFQWVLQTQGLANKNVQIVHKSLYNRNSWVEYGKETDLLADRYLQEIADQKAVAPQAISVYINTCRDSRKNSNFMNLEKYVRARYWLKESGPLAQIVKSFPLQVISEAYIENSINAVFQEPDRNDTILFLGYESKPALLTLGDHLTCKTYWKKLASTEHNYWMFFQITDPDHNIIIHQINPLGAGRFGTSRWPSDKIVVDETELLISEDLFQAGEYKIRIGVFDPDQKANRRLKVVNYSSLENQDSWAEKYYNVVLTELKINPSLKRNYVFKNLPNSKSEEGAAKSDVEPIIVNESYGTAGNEQTFVNSTE